MNKIISTIKLNFNLDIKIVESFETADIIGRCFYPSDPEGQQIQIIKGLNIIEFSRAIHHEIGHLFDWYNSNGKQSDSSEIRELNADIIGESIRFKQSSDVKESL